MILVIFIYLFKINGDIGDIGDMVILKSSIGSSFILVHTVGKKIRPKRRECEKMMFYSATVCQKIVLKKIWIFQFLPSAEAR